MKERRTLCLQWENYNGNIIALGDMIDCMAIYVKYSLKLKEKGLGLRLPVLPHNKRCIEGFLPPELDIELYPIRSYGELADMSMQPDAIFIKPTDMWFRGCRIQPVIESIYVAAGLDFAKRDFYCPVINNSWRRFPQLPVPTEPYAFIPEGGSERLPDGTPKYKCDRKHVGEGLKVIVPPQDAFLPEWGDIIYNATEIHAHPTAWTIFISKTPTKGKLFYHLYTRGINLPISEYVRSMNKHWYILETNEVGKYYLP